MMWSAHRSAVDPQSRHHGWSLRAFALSRFHLAVLLCGWPFGRLRGLTGGRQSAQREPLSRRQPHQRHGLAIIFVGKCYRVHVAAEYPVNVNAGPGGCRRDPRLVFECALQ